MKLLYQGSVKNLYELPGGHLEFEFSDAYSVFDWGRMPDLLPGKGQSLAAMTSAFFGLLGARQFDHHFLQRSGLNRIQVERVRVPRKNSELAKGDENVSGELVPLEVVFRFGMPLGSSLRERLTPDYAKELGVDADAKEGAFFKEPVVEFFTKLEATDRFLTKDEAAVYTGLTRPSLLYLENKTIEIAKLISKVFSEIGLELWDGKLEWAKTFTDPGEAPGFFLVDSIGPDELRLLVPGSGIQVSKEFLRNYYRKTDWYKAVTEEKKSIAPEDHTWRNRVLKKIGPPPNLDVQYLEVAQRLYPSLALALTKENPENLGIPMPDLFKKMAAVS